MHFLLEEVVQKFTGSVFLLLANADGVRIIIIIMKKIRSQLKLKKLQNSSFFISLIRVITTQVV